MATSIIPGDQRRPVPQLPTDREIIEACDRNPPCDENEIRLKGLKYPPHAPIFWIKYGYLSEGRDAEGRTQDFAFRALEQIPPSEREGIRIPEVYRIFSTDKDRYGDCWVYIVMEYVPGKTLLQMVRDNAGRGSVEHLFDSIAKAIQLFLSFEVPNDATPGPYKGGIIRHPLFKYYEAAIQYSSVAQLQRHINKVATMIRSDQPTVDFSKEKLCFCFADLYEGNFLFTDRGSLYVIDFEQANFLPITFMTYALIQERMVCFSIRDRFSFLPRENLPGMIKAGSYFIMSKHTIGLPLEEAPGEEAEIGP